jgi:lysozyme family protein
MKCDNVPAGLDLCLFDFGVNAGTGRSAKFLQRMIGTTADGGIGPNTLKKLADYIDTHGLEETIKEFQEDRQDYYEKLSTFKTFGRGWTRRVDETTELALSMV